MVNHSTQRNTKQFREHHTHEITIDAETMRGEIAFYAVPRLEVVSNNEDGPTEGADVLSLVMAGEGFEPPTSGL